jgi:uncharacterized protein with PIN domain
MKRKFELEFTIDDLKAVKIAGRLFSEFYSREGFFKDYSMPEHVLPRNLQEGTVRCPQCNNVISPDDFSNTAYEVLDAIVDKRGELMKVVVRCLVCKCDIVIVLKPRSALHNSIF